MEDIRRILCERCKSFKPFLEIKYISKGDEAKMALCSGCRDKAKLEEKKKIMMAAQKEKQKSSYYCRRCRYKFSYDPQGMTNLKCPYCGKADKVEKHDPQSAEKLLEELDGF